MPPVATGVDYPGIGDTKQQHVPIRHRRRAGPAEDEEAALRSRVCAAALTAALAGAATLAGCDSGGAEDPAAPTASSDGSSEPAPEETGGTDGTGGTGGTGPAEPTAPEAATGPRVETQVVVYHLPADGDWELSEGGTHATWWRDGAAAPWTVAQFEHDERTPPDLEEIADSVLRSERGLYGKGVRRVADRTVGGTTAFALEYRGRNSAGSPEYVYEVGAVNGSWWSTLTFKFPRRTPQARAVIDSVLASVEWKPIG